MEIDKIESLLKKYSYQVRRYNNKLVVKLPFSQIVIVDCSNAPNIKISSKLVSWNFLTGILEMELSSAFKYSFVGMIIVALLFTFLDPTIGETIHSFYIVLAFIGWIVMWCTFYLVSFHSLRQTIILLNED